MAARRPLVRVGGQNVQLPAGDTVPGVDASKLPLTGGRMTGPINESTFAGTPTGGGGIVSDAIVSASNNLYVYGSGSISGLADQPEGSQRKLFFFTSCLLSNNTYLLNLTGADISAVAGDWCEYTSMGSGVWRMSDYSRFDGTPLVRGSSGPANTDALPEGSTNLYFTAARVLGTALAGFASAVGAVSASDSILSAIGKLQGTKVDAVSGKGLSTNDYTTAEQTKLAGIATGATNNPDTGSLAEGTNLYFTQNRVRATLLTGLSVATGGVIAAADTVLQAFGKLQYQLSNLTKSSVGLANVDNTSDVNKPVSTAQQTALNLKANSANPVFTGTTTTFSTEVVRHDPPAGVSAGYEVGSTAGQATTPYMDFHSGATATDYDFRLLFSGGTGTAGQGSAKFMGADVTFQCKAAFAFPMQLPQYTVSTLPSAAAYSGFLIDVTNAQGGPKVCRSDGSAWKILNGTTTVS